MSVESDHEKEEFDRWLERESDEIDWEIAAIWIAVLLVCGAFLGGLVVALLWWLT